MMALSPTCSSRDDDGDSKRDSTGSAFPAYDSAGAATADDASNVAYYVALRDPPQEKNTAMLEKAAASWSSQHGSDHHSVWTRGALAIPVTYLCVGVLLSFPRAYIEYFPRTLHATDAQLSTVLVMRSLPWCVKVVFGVLPDNFPVQRLRFKPYMLLGYAMSSWFHFLLATMSDSLSVASFSLLLLGAMVGIVMADVMGDALVANRVLRQQEAYPGQVQSIVYMCRFFSEMVGYWGGALLSNRAHWGVGLSMGQVFGFLALLPLVTVVPCIWLLDEPPATRLATWAHQRELLWLMLQRRATWQPLCFLALFNALLLHNSAWGNYLSVAFRFDAFQYGAMSAIGATVTFCAILVYRHWIMARFANPWHYVYFVTGVVAAVFSVLNVLLVFHVNDALGIPAFWFAVGDAAVISFAKGFQQLPLAIMLVSVCPENQEGVAYALLTSITNLAQAFAHTVSNMLLRLWPVELPDLVSGDYSGVWKLTVLTSAISLVPLLFVTTLLPSGRSAQQAMRDQLSERGAQLVTALYTLGFIWVVSLSLIAIVEPCNVFVGGHGCPPST